MKCFSPILLFVLFNACSNDRIKSEGNKFNYRIEINYPLHDSIIYQHFSFTDDSLLVFFESNFENDTVKIFINEDEYFSGIFTTEPSTGLAKEVKCPSALEVNSIGVRVNNGKLIHIETNNLFFFIGIRHEDSKVVVNFHEKIPIYY